MIEAGTPYGFQWWLHQYQEGHQGVVSDKVRAGDAGLRGGSSVFYALDNAGQVILVNPAEDTVVVKWAIWDRRRQDRAFFAALFDALNSRH